MRAAYGMAAGRVVSTKAPALKVVVALDLDRVPTLDLVPTLDRVRPGLEAAPLGTTVGTSVTRNRVLVDIVAQEISAAEKIIMEVRTGAS